VTARYKIPGIGMHECRDKGPAGGYSRPVNPETSVSKTSPTFCAFSSQRRSCQYRDRQLMRRSPRSYLAKWLFCAIFIYVEIE